MPKYETGGIPPVKTDWDDTFGDWDRRRGELLTDLRSGWDLLERDARAVVPGTQILRDVQAEHAAAERLSTSAASAEVVLSLQDLLARLSDVRGATTPEARRRVWASAPVEAIRGVDTGRAPAVVAPTVARWTALRSQVERLLPAGNDLRRAVEAWSSSWAEVEGAHGGGAESRDSTRWGRLLAYAQTELDRAIRAGLVGRAAGTGGNGGVTVPPTVGPDRPRPPASDSKSGWLLAALAVAAVVAASRKKGRGRRADWGS